MRTETIKSIDLFINHNIKYKHLYSRRDIFSLSEKKTEKNIKIIEIKFKFSETMAWVGVGAREFQLAGCERRMISDEWVTEFEHFRVTSC